MANLRRASLNFDGRASVTFPISASNLKVIRHCNAKPYDTAITDTVRDIVKATIHRTPLELRNGNLLIQLLRRLVDEGSIRYFVPCEEKRSGSCQYKATYSLVSEVNDLEEQFEGETRDEVKRRLSSKNMMSWRAVSQIRNMLEWLLREGSLMTLEDVQARENLVAANGLVQNG